MRKFILYLSLTSFFLAGLLIFNLFTQKAQPASSLDPLQLPATSGQISTDSNLKVAFIGDSGDGSGFEQVLSLIRNEHADLVLHQGDFSYKSGPAAWPTKINTILGNDFPYLGSDGNHDDWADYALFFRDRLVAMNLPVNTVITGNGNYHAIYKGLKIVFVKEGGDSDYITQQLTNDPHLWKICSWHKNQRTMQLGGKGDEQGWPSYEICRQRGAIIATAHEHSYQRTKTLNHIQNLSVDENQHPRTTFNGIPNVYSNPDSLQVAPGKTFVFVSGLGGHSVRHQQRCLPATYPFGGGTDCNYLWANIYTTNQNGKLGALFITFNVDGDPAKANGYFKNIHNQIVDQFTITASLI